jgi:multidrug efflux pump subunit AcrA (membrane-fusion protein)
MFDTTELKQLLDGKVAERDTADTNLKMAMSTAQMNREDEDLAVAEAKAELRKANLKAEAPQDLTAELELEKAKLDLALAREKVTHLLRKGANAKKADQADIKRWKGKRDRARGRVEEITAAIERMAVKASRTGTVIYQTNWQGEKKKVGDRAWRGESLLQLASIEKMEAGGEIDEVDVSRVAVEQPVSLRLDAQPDVELRGTLQEISDAVQRTSPENPLKVARVVVTLDETHDVALRPGMRFRGKIETERIGDVLLVPLEAIETTPDGPVAQRRNGLSVEAVPVELGRRNATHVEIVDGLSEGDELFLSLPEVPK